jgi:hypothetical protein
MHRKHEWAASDHVGIFDGDAAAFPEVSTLETALRVRGASDAVCIVGRAERRPLNELLGGHANGEALVRFLFERLAFGDPRAVERKVTAFDSAWLAPPSSFRDYVHRWLVPARTAFRARRDPVLARLLGAGGPGVEASKNERTLRRILMLLPAIAFSFEGRPLRVLDLSRK